MMRILEATVDRYGLLGGWAPTLSTGLTVLSGPNEAGKTLYLEAVLQLLDPAVVDVLQPSPRYDEDPVGRVVLNYGDEQYDLGDGTALRDVTPIQPTDLQTVFVVRDNDLAMPEGPTYYTELVEHLGEVHGSAIESIIDELKRVGRLTEKRLKVSDQYDAAKSTRNDAEALAGDIRGFLDEVEAEGMAELQADRLRVERELRHVQSALEEQRLAKRTDTCDRLRGELDRYESTSERLDALEPFSHERLQELRELDSERAHAKETLDDLEADLRAHRETLADTEEAIRSRDEAVRRFATRRDAVDRADRRLAEYRDRRRDAVGIHSRQSIWRNATIAGLIGTGIVGAAGALVGSMFALLIAAGLLLVTGFAGVHTYRTQRTAEAVEDTKDDAVSAARDAGFSVDAVEEVAPAIEEFRTEFDALKDELARAQERRDRLEATLAETTDQRDSVRGDLERATSTLDDELAAADVDSIEDFEAMVDERTDTSRKRELAEQRLADGLGDPAADAWEEGVAAWEDTLRTLEEELEGTEVAPGDYDEERLHRLEARLGELEHRRDELEGILDRYDDRLDEFADRARSIDARPILEEQLMLGGRSPEALRALEDRLRLLVERIERDAELSRKAIDIFEDIAAAEERKIAELFDPDGPASTAFRHITDERYVAVEYDPTADRIVVERADGRLVSATELSEGAADQLYLASRLSLADRILDGTPGFLLLDDPLIGADPHRLYRGFETLVELAEDGWQILYLTAKAEVYEDMVDAFDLHHEVVTSIT